MIAQLDAQLVELTSQMELRYFQICSFSDHQCSRVDRRFPQHNSRDWLGSCQTTQRMDVIQLKIVVFIEVFQQEVLFWVSCLECVLSGNQAQMLVLPHLCV